MAAGFARASGKVGVFIVTSGPGATNSVTPIRDCMADSVPVVLVCGQVPRAAIGTDAFQEAPVFNIMSACAKKTFLVLDPEELEATVRTAFEIARSDRPGPVVIDVPKDVQNCVGTYKGEDSPLRGIASTCRISTHRECRIQVRRSSTSAKRRPLLYVGGGVIKVMRQENCASSQPPSIFQ
jgi:acetolactate synthase-1/2/3 large subunit